MTQVDDPIEGEVRELGVGEQSSSPYLPVRTSQDRAVYLPAKNLDLQQLAEKPKGKNYVKTRMGRGGAINYIPWTAAADCFDDVFGPGQWSCEPEHDKIEWAILPFTDKDGKMIEECTIPHLFYADGLLRPLKVYGWGRVYYGDENAHRSDAIESAISRATTKAGGRLSKYLRSVWAKDDDTMAAISPPNDTQVASTTSLVTMLNNTGKTKEVADLLTKAGVEDKNYKKITAMELTQLNKDLAGLLA